jgi:serine/threonine-protein kinase
VKATAPRLKVTDFGIARHGASQMTEAGSIMGTAQYLSPEQARGAPVTAASDLYSAGVVLYEMLTGKVPFTGDSAIEIAMKHVNELPKPPSKLRPEIPPELDQVVLRSLAKDPADRYQTADEFIEDLERVESGLPISRATSAAATALLAGAAAGEATQVLTGEEATRVVSQPPVPQPPRRPPEYPPAGPYDEPPRKRRRWVPWVLVALLIAGAALAGWWAYNAIQDQLEASEPVGVPNVEGLREDPAVQQLESRGFVAKVQRESSTEVDAGVVIDQSPDAGTQVAKGSTVTITVSSGPKQVEVPKLVGKTYEQAVDLLNAVNLEARRRNVFSDRPQGRVAAQDPKAGETVDEGTEVVVSVSQGPEQIGVPDVVGMSQANATATLEAADFVVSVVEQPSSTTAAGTVILQSPSAGVDADKGSTVTITVSTGPSQVNVPNVVGDDEASATNTLEGQGFTVRVRSTSGDLGIVQSQDPAAGTQVNEGSRVTIFVGDGT